MSIFTIKQEKKAEVSSTYSMETLSNKIYSNDGKALDLHCQIQSASAASGYWEYLTLH